MKLSLPVGLELSAELRGAKCHVALRTTRNGRLAAELEANPERLARARAEVSEKISEMQVEAKDIRTGEGVVKRLVNVA